MQYSIQEIEDLLYSIPENSTLMDLLAPQEVENLAVVISQVISGYVTNGGKLDIEETKQKIISELKEPEDFFGIKDLAYRLNLSDFLKKVSQDGL